LVRYRSKAGNRSVGKRYTPRDPYSILNLYNQSNPYKPHDRKGARMRRGYNSRLYSPSRRQGYSPQPPNYKPKTAHLPRIHYQPQPPYRPQPKQSIARSSPHPLHKIHRYTEPRTRIEPDVEEMLKQLEKRFDKKLHEQVLERLEAEMEKFEEAIKEKSEAVENSDVPEQERIESILSEKLEQEPESDELKNEDSEAYKANNKTSEEKKLYDAQPETEQRTETQVPEEPNPQETETAEPLSEGELFEPEDDLEWLREQGDEAEPEQSDAKPTETMEQRDRELLQQLVIEKVLSEILPLEEPVEIEPEQLADLEPILDQIEPIESELIELVEANPLTEILPEPLEEEVIEEEALEGEA